MSQLYIGLMSGTSLDGVDAVLADFSQPIPKVLATFDTPYPATLRKKVLSLCSPGSDEIDAMGELDIELGHWFADTVIQLLQQAGKKNQDIIAIGSHGQTIRHRPELPHPFSLQIGDPNTIAYDTGITTIGDFRRLDIAAGGQGAPLVPAFHQAVFSDKHEDRVILNIGGIANITRLACNGDAVIGFDTGPGNVLIDSWMQAYYEKPYDADGEKARSGEIQTDLLEYMLSDPFFQIPPPKSTGREHFNIKWINERMHKTMSARDILTTLVELTAITSADAIKNHSPQTQTCFVCGGGAKNAYLMERIRSHLPGIRVSTTDEIGLASDWVEATAFAWLAYRRINKLPGNLPAVTGAQAPVLLGAIYEPF
jgi:anhydro-N-acetylmuramic acid kinase